MRILSILLMWGIAMMTTGEPASATMPRSAPKTEAEAKLAELVAKLRAKKDTPGLLLALEAASCISGGQSATIERDIVSSLEQSGLTPEAVAALVEKVQGDTVALGTRIEAAKVLGQSQDQRAVDALVGVARKQPEKDDIARRALRSSALQSLAGLGGVHAKAAVLESLSDAKEHMDVRRVALFALERMDLSDAERLYVLRLAAGVEHDESISADILELPERTHDARWIGPAIEVLGTISALMEGKDAKAAHRAGELFIVGLRAVESAADKAGRPLGHRLAARMGDVTFSCGAGKGISYQRDKLMKDSADRKRVLESWSSWWSENRKPLEGKNAVRDSGVEPGRDVPVARG